MTPECYLCGASHVACGVDGVPLCAKCRAGDRDATPEMETILVTSAGYFADAPLIAVDGSESQTFYQCLEREIAECMSKVGISFYEPSGGLGRERALAETRGDGFGKGANS